jgi:hypothetical protein
MAARTPAPIAVGIAAGLCAVLVGCATTRIDPALYDKKTFALASVHARREIAFDTSNLALAYDDNELGAEVVEMSLGDTEADLANLFGVEEIVPLGKALKERTYDDLPEATPPESWSQINNITAVDVDSPRAAPALGALAKAMHVDAVVVLRHEWALSRDRLELSAGITAYDRCTLLVVDDAGRPLWDDVMVARQPVTLLWAGDMSAGVNGATWADEARALARRTGRECMDLLKRRYAEARPKKPAAPPPP